VDFHGIANWVPDLEKDQALPEHWWQVSADWKEAIATAFAASPDADIAKWKSPVLLIQGDDDRNVPFDQTVELAHRLEQQHTPFEELVIPNEIHGFLRWMNWVQADEATVEFLSRELGVQTKVPHRSVVFAIASGVKTGIFSPEKNARCKSRPATKAAIHWVSSDPHRVFLCRNFLVAGMLRR
jgi:hypothetical protein